MEPAPTVDSGKTEPQDLNKEYADTQELINRIKQPLTGLAVSLDGLEGQTMQIALLGSQIGTKQEITDFRDSMRQQDQRHKDGIAEIQAILKEMLETHVVENMRKQVEEDIAGQIDDLLQQGIEECLRDHIPQELQDEIADNQRELEEVRLALHNSESRRLNGNLRSNKPDERLGTIYTRNGILSANYPKDLKALFSLDGDSLKALMEDYDFPNITDSRDLNLNRFMQFCGVRYQLVRRADGNGAKGSKPDTVDMM